MTPSKWDADNLHRHPDYAPRRTHSTYEAQTEPSRPPRTSSIQSKTTNSTEFDDDFGGNLFDGVEINPARPDEMVLDNTSVSGESTETRQPEDGQKTSQPSQPRQPIGRIQSMPAMRPPAPVTVPSNIPPQQRPLGVGLPQQQEQQHGPVFQSNKKSEVYRSRLDALETNQNQRRQQIPAGNEQTNGNPAQQQQSGSKDVNIDSPAPFVTGHAANLLYGKDAILPPNAPAFNPHSESPSLRRTNGFDHSRSTAITKAALGTGAMSHQSPGGQKAAQQVPQQHQPPQARGNLVNPQLDTHRRIGMPGAVQSPLANRAGYRPPGPAHQKRDLDGGARPPLADVSNVTLDGGGDGLDVKRQRVTG